MPKTVFSHAMTMMARWKDGKWVGSKFARLWIYIQTVLCDEYRRPPQNRKQMLVIIMECVTEESDFQI